MPTKDEASQPHADEPDDGWPPGRTKPITEADLDRAIARDEAISGLAALGWELPADYAFNRNEANARSAGFEALRHLSVTDELKASILAAAGGGLPASEAAARLCVSPEELEARRLAGGLLAVSLADGAWLYPAGQFTEAGVISLVPELLHACMTPWSSMSWLVAPTEVLGGRSALEVLRNEGSEDVATVARMLEQMEIDAYG